MEAVETIFLIWCGQNIPKLGLFFIHKFYHPIPKKILECLVHRHKVPSMACMVLHPLLLGNVCNYNKDAKDYMVQIIYSKTSLVLYS